MDNPVIFRDWSTPAGLEQPWVSLFSGAEGLREPCSISLSMSGEEDNAITLMVELWLVLRTGSNLWPFCKPEGRNSPVPPTEESKSPNWDAEENSDTGSRVELLSSDVNTKLSELESNSNGKTFLNHTVIEH